MKSKNKNTSDLRIIPLAGKSIAVDLHNIGVHTVADLKGKDQKNSMKCPIVLQVRFRIGACCMFSGKQSILLKNNTHDPKKIT